MVVVKLLLVALDPFSKRLPTMETIISPISVYNTVLGKCACRLIYKMKLSTFNFLTSKAIKGVKVGYPLKLTIIKQNVVENEFNPTFVERLIPKLDWSTVHLTAQLTDMNDIPAEIPSNIGENEELLKKLHHLLLEIDIVEGKLECPETGRVFPIIDGIPNMLLNEDEV